MEWLLWLHNEMHWTKSLGLLHCHDPLELDVLPFECKTTIWLFAKTKHVSFWICCGFFWTLHEKCLFCSQKDQLSCWAVHVACVQFFFSIATQQRPLHCSLAPNQILPPTLLAERGLWAPHVTTWGGHPCGFQKWLSQVASMEGSTFCFPNFSSWHINVCSLRSLFKRNFDPKFFLDSRSPKMHASEKKTSSENLQCHFTNLLPVQF
jgi:hypothetical protein